MFKIKMIGVLCCNGDFLSYSSFLETNVPLLVLIEAAKAGNEKEVEEYALVFTEHANKLVEVSKMLTFFPFVAERCRVHYNFSQWF